MSEFLNVRQIETRDPRAATQQLAYVGKGMAQVPKWNPERAITQGYDASWVVNRCIDIIAGDLAGLPFRAGLDPEKPQEFNPNAPLARMFGPAPFGPAPKLASETFWWWMIAQYLVTGLMGAEIELDDTGRPIYLWPLTAANLQAVPTDSGSEWWSHFKYGRHDKPVKLPPDRVFYHWRPSLSDFRQPFSPLMSARLDVSVHVMMGRFAYSFYSNGAVPAFAVITDAFPNESERQRFRQEWRGNYQGPDNAGKVAFFEAEEGESPLEETLVIKQLGISQKDALTLEHQKYLDEAIASALGVPFSRIQASGRTFDNAAQEDKNYWRRIADLAREFAGAVNMQLAPRIGPEVGWFDLSKVEALKTRPVPVTQPVGVPELVRSQLMTIDEARAEYGLPPLPNGEGARFLTVEEVQALSGTPDEDIPRALEPETRDTPADTPGPEIETEAPDQEERRLRIWRTADAAVRSLERRWERAWVKLFNRQRRAAVRTLQGKRGHKLIERRETDPDAVFNLGFWTDETRDMVADLYEAVAVQGLARVSERFAIDFDLEAEDVQRFIQERANKLAGDVTETTYRKITDELAEGVSKGEGIPALARRIEEVFDDATRTRAATIARTEVISAYNGAATLGASMLPDDVVGGQEWIATRDGRTRPEHASADGQVRRVGEPFDVGGTPMAYPGDPAANPGLTVNCRCTVALLTPDEYDAAKAEGRTTLREVRVSTARALLEMPFDERKWRGLLREVAA